MQDLNTSIQDDLEAITALKLKALSLSLSYAAKNSPQASVVGLFEAWLMTFMALLSSIKDATPEKRSLVSSFFIGRLKGALEEARFLDVAERIYYHAGTEGGDKKETRH